MLFQVAPVRFTNAFTSEEVCSMVAAHKTKRVLLCGGWYEACILSTCHACLERDITVRTSNLEAAWYYLYRKGGRSAQKG